MKDWTKTDIRNVVHELNILKTREKYFLKIIATLNTLNARNNLSIITGNAHIHELLKRLKQHE